MTADFLVSSPRLPSTKQDSTIRNAAFFIFYFELARLGIHSEKSAKSLFFRMDPNHIQLLLDHAQAELEAAKIRESVKATELRISHSDTKGKMDTVRVLTKELALAQKVTNIRIWKVGGTVYQCIRINDVNRKQISESESGYEMYFSVPDRIWIQPLKHWIELLRQNRLGVTDRTVDRTDSNRQDVTMRTGKLGA
jgi:hypothetical protein